MSEDCKSMGESGEVHMCISLGGEDDSKEEDIYKIYTRERFGGIVVNAALFLLCSLNTF